MSAYTSHAAATSPSLLGSSSTSASSERRRRRSTSAGIMSPKVEVWASLAQLPQAANASSPPLNYESPTASPPQSIAGVSAPAGHTAGPTAGRPPLSPGMSFTPPPGLSMSPTGRDRSSAGTLVGAPGNVGGERSMSGLSVEGTKRMSPNRKEIGMSTSRNPSVTLQSPPHSDSGVVNSTTPPVSPVPFSFLPASVGSLPPSPSRGPSMMTGHSASRVASLMENGTLGSLMDSIGEHNPKVRSVSHTKPPSLEGADAEDPGAQLEYAVEDTLGYVSALEARVKELEVLGAEQPFEYCAAMTKSTGHILPSGLTSKYRAEIHRDIVVVAVSGPVRVEKKPRWGGEGPSSRRVAVLR